MNRTMKQESTRLSYALLGLLQQKPASGYDLRKIFTETPMANMSDSPGAIYPALRRLEERKLISSAVEHGPGLRQRRILRITGSGLAELTEWLKTPLKEEDVADRLDEIMLRFAFSDSVIGEAATLEFLQSLESLLKRYLAKLKQHLESNKTKMRTSSRLALENGAFGYEAQLKWTKHAITIYTRKVK